MFISQQTEGSDSKAGAELLDIVLKRVRDDSVTSYLAYLLTKENKAWSNAYKFYLQICFCFLRMYGIWIF